MSQEISQQHTEPSLNLQPWQVLEKLKEISRKHEDELSVAMRSSLQFQQCCCNKLDMLIERSEKHELMIQTIITMLEEVGAQRPVAATEQRQDPLTPEPAAEPQATEAAASESSEPQKLDDQIARDIRWLREMAERQMQEAEAAKQQLALQQVRAEEMPAQQHAEPPIHPPQPVSSPQQEQKVSIVEPEQSHFDAGVQSESTTTHIAVQTERGEQEEIPVQQQPSTPQRPVAAAQEDPVRALWRVHLDSPLTPLRIPNSPFATPIKSPAISQFDYMPSSSPVTTVAEYEIAMSKEIITIQDEGSVNMPPELKLIFGGESSLSVWSQHADKSTREGVFFGHTSYIWDLELHRDELCSCSADGTVLIWDMARGICKRNITHGAAVNALLSHSYLLFTGCDDSYIRMFNTANGKCVGKLYGHSKGVQCLSDLDDVHYPHLIASASAEPEIRLWDVERGVCVRSFGSAGGHWATILSLHYDKMSHLLYSGGLDKRVCAWDVRAKITASPSSSRYGASSRYGLHLPQQVPVRILEGQHTHMISSITRYNSFLVSAGSELCIWDLASGRLVGTVDHPKRQEIRSVAQVGDYLVSTSEDRSVRFWQSSSNGTEWFLRKTMQPVTSLDGQGVESIFSVLPVVTRSV